MESTVKFNKRRKPVSNIEHRQTPTPTASEDTEVADLLRHRRKQSKPRRGGVEFSQSASLHQVGPHLPASLEEVASKAEADRSAADIAQSRFAPQTGAVSDANNQHMMAYVESKMKQLHAGPQSSSQLSSGHPAGLDPSSALSNLPHRQPAALGQIQEIDLGPDAAKNNIARTELATRRLANGEAEDEHAISDKSKVKLGRDGKPRKQRKRRASDDLKRDQVVEAFLHENKLDLYDEGDDPLIGEAGEGEEAEAADDLIAEKFQRDFLDAIQSRNRMNRARKRAPTTQKKGPTDDKSKGPKLGGSRSARAAMHAAGKVKGSKR